MNVTTTPLNQTEFYQCDRKVLFVSESEARKSGVVMEWHNTVEVNHHPRLPIHTRHQLQRQGRGKWWTFGQTLRLSFGRLRCRAKLSTGYQSQQRDRKGLSFFRRLSGANCFLFRLSHRSSFLDFIRLSDLCMSDIRYFIGILDNYRIICYLIYTS